MSSTRSGYKKLGLKPNESLQDQSCRARKQPMGDENKDDVVGYLIKMFLEEALVRQRNEMSNRLNIITHRYGEQQKISSEQ